MTRLHITTAHSTSRVCHMSFYCSQIDRICSRQHRNGYLGTYCRKTRNHEEAGATFLWPKRVTDVDTRRAPHQNSTSREHLVFHPWHDWSHDESALQYGRLCAESLYFPPSRSFQLPPYLPASALILRPSSGFIYRMTSASLDLFIGL
jgi:hypothetical protein